MQTVRHNGRGTGYRVDDRGGDRTPMLCVHGSGGFHGVWRGQTRLAEDRPVVSLDLSGHGGSEDVDADAGYEALSAYVDDVLAVARGTDARILVGNSLGGAVVLTAALEREYDLEGLVVAGSGAKLAVLEDLLVWLEEDFDRAVEFLHEPDRLFHDADEETVAASREAMWAAGQAVTSRDFRTCHRFDVRDRLGRVSTPTLAIVGENDQLTPRRYHEYLADEMPACQLAVVEDAAHLAMLERPGAFNAALDEFFDRFVDGDDSGTS
jgi:pimeloyl-ACP methyl ester carboxylesterase